MKEMFRMKKAVSILLFILMVIVWSDYGLALDNGKNDNDIVTEKPKVKAEKADEEMIKIYDENKDKLFESLSKRMEKADEKENMSVIVVFSEKFTEQKDKYLASTLEDYEVKYEYKNIPAVAMKLNKGQIQKLLKMDAIRHIEYDEPVMATNGTANYWFGAEKARLDFQVDGDRDGNSASYTKDDVVVAVIDTGIYGGHVDLDGGKIIGWKDYVGNKTSPYDDNGHGTHVAATIAGEGQGNQDYTGVAKGTALVGLKVLDRRGSGSMSDVTAAVDWCITNKDAYGIDIINMSLGTSGSSDGTDATSMAVNNAVDHGIVVVVAAGNSGPGKYTIGSPGAASKAITVAAMADVGEKGFNLTDFSSRGPTADGRTKPDIAAPGYNITSAKTNTASGYVTYSGTSMATPFTAGVVALMLDANESLTPAQVKSVLTSTAQDWGLSGQDIEYGYGRLDAFAAVKDAGGYSGSNLAVPNHMHASQSLSAKGTSDYWEFEVDSTEYPVAITMIMPDWKSGAPDFDIYLYAPNGSQVATSTGTTRQENINYVPSSTGTYKLRVYSYSGSGSYFFDISTGGDNLIITQDQ